MDSAHSLITFIENDIKECILYPFMVAMRIVWA